MGSMERSLDDAQGLVDSPSLKNKNTFRDKPDNRHHSAIQIKNFFLWDRLALALSDSLLLFVNLRLRGESSIGTFLVCIVVKIQAAFFETSEMY